MRIISKSSSASMFSSRPILYVAYPLLPVHDGSGGGAEQVLLTIEREMSRRNWATTIAACAGSQAAGGLYNTGAAGNGSLRSAQAHEEKCARKILELVSVREAIGRGFEVIHDHSGSFFRNAGELDTPVLATLHLPRSFYPPGFFSRVPANV